MVINGIARKFKTIPAKLTRENMAALMGISAASAQIVAAGNASSGSIQRRSRCESAVVIRWPAETKRGTPMRMARVAPNVSAKPASKITSGFADTMTRAAKASPFIDGVR